MTVGKKKKKEIAAQLIKHNIAMFCCPICKQSMSLKNTFTLTCQSNHSFDITKKGYVNLLLAKPNSNYEKELFIARRQVIEEGFFAEIVDEIVKIIVSYTHGKNLKVLDAGCGEGSLLYSLSQEITQNSLGGMFGVDIAKEAIQIAAHFDSEIIWSVADLANLPFQSNSLDVILNILSPANYDEFDRVLKDDGIVIKVVPEEHYLMELREALNEKKTYTNDHVVNHFAKHLDVIHKEKVHYQFPLNSQVLPALIKMTPLTWGKVHTLEGLGKGKVKFVTIEVTILVGKKRKK